MSAARARARQVLAHRFLCPAAPEPLAQPMRFHAFMSHAQADAAGTVRRLLLPSRTPSFLHAAFIHAARRATAAGRG